MVCQLVESDTNYGNFERCILIFVKLFLKKYSLAFIFLLAFILRVWGLEKTPDGFHVDEVKVGWNAYSILKTGQDDWGHKFSLHYNTFGDFRPTGLIYLTIPSIAIFGLNEFAVRFPGALAGSLTVVVLYLFLKELLSSSEKLTRSLAHSFPLLASLMLSLSPWHISLSRATSEAIIAIFLTLTGLWLLIKYLKTPKPAYVAACFLFLVGSYFFYHSARLLVPILATCVVGYFLWLRRSKKPDVQIQIHSRRPSVFSGLGTTLRNPEVVLCLCLFLITLVFSLNPAARGRLNQVSIFNDLDIKYELDKMPFEEGPNKIFIARLFHNKPIVYTRHFINQYTKYFSSDFFLTPKVAKPGRYQTVGMGVLTYVELALLIAGVIALIRNPKNPLALCGILLLLAPLPAAITTEDSPNLSRAAYMIPFISAISGLGLWHLSKVRTRNYSLRAICYVLLGLNFIFFLHMYFIHNRVGNTMARSVGTKELAIVLGSLARRYDQIYLTNIPDSPYPWIAYFQKLDPKTFNEKAMVRDKGRWTYKEYNFLTARCPSRDAFQNQGKILAVDADACEAQSPEGAKMLDQIRRPDGTIVYTLWSRE